MVYLFAFGALLAALVLAARLAPVAMTAAGLWLERRISGLRTRSAHVDGFAMPYLEGGKGEVLLLIHGFGGDKDNFTRIARFLTPHYRVIIPDLPGFGDATRDPRASYAMADQVARIHSFISALGIERLHLGGNSMGGFIAAQFAVPYGHMVQSLWLLDPAGTAASHDSDMLRHYEATGECPLLVRRVEDFDATIAITTHKTPFVPRFARIALGRRGVADLALHTRIMRQMQESPLLEATYQPMPTPALVVWGEEDKVLSPAGAASFKLLFPNAQVIMMAGIGHLPMAEAPKRTAQDYLRYRAALAT
ncbi:MAG TPA: alpha/beta hydrolase [Telluria sp.]|jgi:triacylglycerol lipase